MIYTTAAILVADGDTAQPLLERFAKTLQDKGLRVGGLVQRSHKDAEGNLTAMELLDIETGEFLPIEQQLGDSAACSIDPQAMAAATQVIRRAVEQRFDLVVVNKFGHLEMDGGGLADETMLAMSEERPLLLTVSGKYLDRWQDFSGGLCEMLPPDEEAVARWWDGLSHS
ncbi:MAG TPA: DUF2478 domain-containing protein [Candidatus Sulfotelmatobacter sp.]|jgi:nucleoside-triphosphatase THEP1|nr:DUF2478 domain-containing protein [Candidatus Sulfotelmatobacter sp.]